MSGRNRARLFLLLTTVVGCSSSAESNGDAPNPTATPHVAGAETERIEQLDALAERRDFSTAPQVFDSLEVESPRVRAAAFRAAEKILGGGIRTRAYDPPERRREAADTYRRLHTLAQETGATHLIDTVPALIDQLESNDEQTRRQAYDDLTRITGIAYVFHADGPPEERRAAVEQYRKLWHTWNLPGNMILEWRRDPEKMRAYKRERVEEIKRRKAGSGS